MTEWSAAEVQKGLLQALAAGLAKHGYEGPRGQSFHRRIPAGRTTFHVAFIRHAADLDVTADVAIRIDALQDLLHRQDPALSKAEARQTASIGAELGNIVGTGQKRWTVRSRGEIQAIADDLVQSFESVGLPYLRAHSNLEDMLAAVSRNDRAGWLHSPVHVKRCKSAVGLAYLLGKTALVDELMRQGEEYLKSTNDWGLPAFIEFVSWLREERARPS